uniref:Uncharacterized protein n=1 Tax=Meloidogyne incognita TaxID=6306 RepID=A0A914MZ65_MELIC
MDTHIIPSINSPILKTNWKSIYIVAIVAFITSLEYAATNDWNYFCQLDPSATITFYGILRTVGGLSGGISTILAGWLCNRWKDTRYGSSKWGESSKKRSLISLAKMIFKITPSKIKRIFN